MTQRLCQPQRLTPEQIRQLREDNLRTYAAKK